MGFGEDVEGEVAAVFGPFVVFGEHGAGEAGDGVAVGKDPDDVGVAADLFVEAFVGYLKPFRGCLCCLAGVLRRA